MAEVNYFDGTGDRLRVVQTGNKVVVGIIANGDEVDNPTASVVLEPEQWTDLKDFLNGESLDELLDKAEQRHKSQ